MISQTSPEKRGVSLWEIEHSTRYLLRGRSLEIMTSVPKLGDPEDHIYSTVPESNYCPTPQDHKYYSAAPWEDSTPTESVADTTSTDQGPLVTDEELRTMTEEAINTQAFVLSQLGKFNTSLDSKTKQIEKLKVELKHCRSQIEVDKGRIESLEQQLEELQNEAANEKKRADCVEKERCVAQCRLEESESTVDYLETVAEQFKKDAQGMRQQLRETEDDLFDYKNRATVAEGTISRLEVIRYEVDNTDRPIDEFVEATISENCALRQQVSEHERTIINVECEKMDLEMCNEALRDTLRDVQMSYADQSGECKDLEKALETMHRLYKSTNEELDNVKGEIKVYETGMGDMLSDLKKSHSVVEATENKRRQSEALTQSTKSKLDKTEAVVAQLHRETEQAERVINMKEDVIRSIHDSIIRVVDSCMEKLAAIGEEKSDRSLGEHRRHDQALEELKHNLKTTYPVNNGCNFRFFDVVDELERKDELLVQLMSENLTRDTATIQDMDDQLATLQEKVRKLTNDRMKMEDSMEEKDLVISHLVNVINRYAYNDRETGDGKTKRISDTSMIGPTIPGAVAKKTISEKDARRRPNKGS
eukprot:sb/3463270/